MKMIEKIIEMYNSEPIAISIGIMIFGYVILRITGLWEWLPNKIYNLGKSKTSNLK